MDNKFAVLMIAGAVAIHCFSFAGANVYYGKKM
jgi:hypothetical protein